VVLSFQPLKQGLKVGEERLSGQTLAGRFTKYGVPVSGCTQAENTPEEIAHAGTAIVVAIVGILFEDLAGNVIVKLKLDECPDRVIVILRRVIVDVRFRYGVAEHFGPRGRWRNSLEMAYMPPPASV
jgi:hypothetical protein